MKRCSERGSALLIVYLMAATIAIMMYLELPRVAFEYERDREQLLIDRGEQYVMAIRRYTKKFNRYPASLDDLEKGNNQRFLRKRYVDPFTGKDDWRIINMGPGGVPLNSKTMQNQGALQKKEEQSSDQTQPAYLQQRASDRPMVNAGGAQISDNPSILDPTQRPPDSSPVIGQPTYPGQPGVPGQPGQPGTPGQPAAPGQPPVIPGLPPGVQPVATPPPAPPGGTVAPGTYSANGTTVTAMPFNSQNMPGMTAPNNTNQPQRVNAVDVINQQLRGGTTNMGQGGGIGGGIGGIASKYQAEGIKVYKEKTKIDEWEFIYDLKKEAELQNRPGVNGPQNNQNRNPLGSSSTNSNSGLSGSSGSSSSSTGLGSGQQRKP